MSSAPEVIDPHEVCWVGGCGLGLALAGRLGADLQLTCGSQ